MAFTSYFTIKTLLSIVDYFIVYSVIKAIFCSLFTVYFINTMRHYYYKICSEMRLILISFQITMTIRLICDITILIILRTKDEYENDEEKQKLIYSVWFALFDLMFIENRVCIIMLYRLLYLLKYAQITINEEYTSMQQILRTLWWNRTTGRLIIFINICTVIS